ncbi:MAG TPA: hypothetical protein VME66_10090 [Candidatus Acidoferrales bacterium]|nr:hypothetical protein [Candidatus Acidoferrales bacterium]
MKRLALALAGLLALTAQSPSPSLSPPANAQDVIDRMLARNAGLVTYTAHVEITAEPSIRLCSIKTDGTAYYKRPGNFAVVLNPASGLCASSLKDIQTLSTDVGNPVGWEKDWNIALNGTAAVGGKPAYVLVLTKKIHSDQVKDTTVYVDPDSYELVEMEWHYTNGDAIAMTQSYGVVDGYSVVERQHFSGRRRIGFSGDSTYDAYQMNVAISDAVFAKQP